MDVKYLGPKIQIQYAPRSHLPPFNAFLGIDEEHLGIHVGRSIRDGLGRGIGFGLGLRLE